MSPSDPGVHTFTAPVLPSLSALQDRSVELEDQDRRFRHQGYVDGHADGVHAGRHEIEQAIADHDAAAVALRRAASMFATAAADLRTRDEVALAVIEADVYLLAVELATELVGRELEITEQPVIDALRRASRLLPDRGAPTVRVSPIDEVAANRAVGEAQATWGVDVRILADPDIEPGGCVVDIGPCRIDAQIGTAVARLRSTTL